MREVPNGVESFLLSNDGFVRLDLGMFNGRSLDFVDEDGNRLGSLFFKGAGNEKNGVRNVAFVFESVNGDSVLLPVKRAISGTNVNVSFNVTENILNGKFLEDDKSKIYFVINVFSDGSVYVKNFYNRLRLDFVYEDLLEVEEGTFNMPEAGDDVEPFSTIVNGRSVAGFSFRMLGNSKYLNVNEDSIAVDEKRIVVADGIGGSFRGDLASFLATSTIIMANRVSLKNALGKASELLVKFNYVLSRYRNSSDTTVVAGEFSGDFVDLISIGDSSWVLIRDGKIVDRNFLNTYLGETKRAYNTNDWDVYNQQGVQGYVNFARQLSYTLFSSLEKLDDDYVFAGEYKQKVYLQEGDYLIFGSDGVFDNLDDLELLFFIEDNPSVDELVRRIKLNMISKNEAGNIHRRLLGNDGKYHQVHLEAALDNCTVCVYKH